MVTSNGSARLQQAARRAGPNFAVPIRGHLRRPPACVRPRTPTCGEESRTRGRMLLCFGLAGQADCIARAGDTAGAYSANSGTETVRRHQHSGRRAGRPLRGCIHAQWAGGQAGRWLTVGERGARRCGIRARACGHLSFCDFGPLFGQGDGRPLDLLPEAGRSRKEAVTDSRIRSQTGTRDRRQPVDSQTGSRTGSRME